MTIFLHPKYGRGEQWLANTVNMHNVTALDIFSFVQCPPCKRYPAYPHLLEFFWKRRRKKCAVWLLLLLAPPGHAECVKEEGEEEEEKTVVPLFRRRFTDFPLLFFQSRVRNNSKLPTAARRQMAESYRTAISIATQET